MEIAEMFAKLLSHNLKKSEFDFAFCHSWLAPQLFNFEAKAASSKREGVIWQTETFAKLGFYK